MIVTGDDFIPHVDLTRNKSGHLLLNTGGPGGYYFMTAGLLFAFPTIMNETQFQRYLQEHGKIIISASRIYIPRPDKSQRKLEQLLAAKRWWLGPVHNCEGLVEEIVMAGGGPRLHTGWWSFPIDSTNQCMPW